MRIAVIGGGISGLAFANVFKRFGHECIVFEKSDRIGGIWATSYPDVRLQNSREQYHFVDLPWPTPPDQQPLIEPGQSVGRPARSSIPRESPRR